jgi:hypothetical protein
MCDLTSLRMIEMRWVSVRKVGDRFLRHSQFRSGLDLSQGLDTARPRKAAYHGFFTLLF